jgi:hypothetical protein
MEQCLKEKLVHLCNHRRLWILCSRSEEFSVLFIFAVKKTRTEAEKIRRDRDPSIKGM